MSNKLNCWPGCLAIVVRSSMGNEGKIVRCKKLVHAGDAADIQGGGKIFFRPGDVNLGRAWVVDRFIGATKTLSGRFVVVNAIIDEALRPLNDSDEQDEMLRIAGLPNKEPAPTAH